MYLYSKFCKNCLTGLVDCVTLTKSKKLEVKTEPLFTQSFANYCQKPHMKVQILYILPFYLVVSAG